MNPRLPCRVVFPLLCVAVMPSVSSAASDGGIPEPRPIKTEVEVHAFYYPGTEQMAEWDLMQQTKPWVKPLLGWYDEGNPDVVDWQIKWAVEHGISAFCVDWYWHRGVRRLEHWVNAYYKARFRRYLPWYVMYANHNDPGSHTEADTRALVRFWCDHYFKTPEYYRIDGKPVVAIWDYRNFGKDFAAEAKTHGETITWEEGLARALALMRRLAREQGVSDLYFIDVYHGWEKCAPWQKLKAAGYDAQTLYGFDKQAFEMGTEYLRPGDSEKRFDFSVVCATVQKWWAKTGDQQGLPFWPFLPTGWDCRPRSFQTPKRVIYGRTPEKFRALLADCRTLCRAKGVRRVMIGPVNEWQEGSYIEPNAEFGFGMYDAIREVFATDKRESWPANVTPSELGLGPYDFAPLKRCEATVWDFSRGGTLGWYRNPYGTACVRNVDGALHYIRGWSSYGAIRTRIRPFSAEDYDALRVKMRVEEAGLPEWVHESGPGRGCLRWGTVQKPLVMSDRARDAVSFDTSRRVEFTPVPDVATREYRIDLRKADGWQGDVDELWFDADSTFFSRAYISSLEFVRNFSVVEGIRYATGAGDLGVGNLYLPERTTAETPIVLLIHGGGFSSGDRYSISGIANFFAERLGCAVFNIEYRLASEKARWPASGDDCVAAANFIRSAAFKRKYGLGHDKIWICGGSAGGHLTLWTLVNLPVDAVAGAVAISPIGDPVPDYAAHRSRYTPLFGANADLAAMDPCTRVKAGMAPLLITHTPGDLVVPVASSRAFAAAYRAAGNVVESFEYASTVDPNTGGHCIWRPHSNPHRLIESLERKITSFVRSHGVENHKDSHEGQKQ